MRLPEAENAIIGRQKIDDYLLSGSHKRGRDKAQFFMSFGFSPAAPDVLQRALLKHAMTNDVIDLKTSEHGAKYTIQGPLPAPDGRAPLVKSVWIVDKCGQWPRFVTAFPSSG